MPTVLSGYGFDEREGPYLLLDELAPGATVRRRALVRGAPMTLSAKKERYCTGTFDLRSYARLPCPEQAPVKGELETCFRCFQRTGFNPSFYNSPREAISPQQRAYNERPHVVYLAYFAEDTVKVGISSQDRVCSRWRGQGARLATRLLLVEDAYAARAVEERVAREAGLPEALRSARKRRLVNLPLDARAGTRTLDVTRERVARSLGLKPDEDRVYDLTLDYLGGAELDFPLTDLSEETRPGISGIGVGMIGEILIVEEASRQFMLSLKHLVGHVVELEASVRPNRRKPTPGQLGFNFG